MFNFWRNRKKEILSEHKKPKESHFDFERISQYFNKADHSHASQVIDDRLVQDLDFHEVFQVLDRTVSSVGQQYFYDVLRTLPKNHDRSNTTEEVINQIHDNPKLKEDVILLLKRLDNPGAYYIQQLFFEENLKRPRWIWLIYTLSYLSIALFLMIFLDQFLFLIALPIFIVNIIIHFWNKSNLLAYSNTIPQFFTLYRVTSKLLEKGAFIHGEEEVRSAVKALKRSVRTGLFFSWEKKSLGELSEIVEYVFDLIKGIFLIEPILFFSLLKRLEVHKGEIKVIFDAVGNLDSSIAIASFRESLPYYCTPGFLENENRLESAAGYHPLLASPVSNDLNTDIGKSILITGSNMSGKTTFIRTIGLNVLLAQTINTACANSFEISRYHIYSAIRLSAILMAE